jgi:CheY-like chemotaxis protein
MISILVVDGDHADRAIARSHLKRAGYDVQTAKSSPEAMLVARHHRPDLIVSTELDGFELCRQLRDDATLDSVPVVLVSERMLSEGDRDRAFEAGALELIEKSVDYKRELTWIDAAIRQVRG